MCKRRNQNVMCKKAFASLLLCTQEASRCKYVHHDCAHIVNVVRCKTFGDILYHHLFQRMAKERKTSPKQIPVSLSRTALQKRRPLSLHSVLKISYMVLTDILHQQQKVSSYIFLYNCERECTNQWDICNHILGYIHFVSQTEEVLLRCTDTTKPIDMSLKTLQLEYKLLFVDA